MLDFVIFAFTAILGLGLLLVFYYVFPAKVTFHLVVMQLLLLANLSTLYFTLLAIITKDKIFL